MCFQGCWAFSFKWCVFFYQWTINEFYFVMLLRVGIEIPTIEIRFEHLNLGAEAHVGSRALPTVINFTFNIIEVMLIYNLI